MNSVIVSAVASIAKKFKRRFLQSKTCVVLSKFYNSFSAGWKNSRIVNFIGSTDKEEYIKKSVVYKIFRLPFTLLEFLQSKIGSFINEKIKTSFICHLAKVYIQNFMALNCKFFGMMILCAAIIYSVLSILFNKELNSIVMFAGVVGVLFIFINCNVTSLFGGSKFISFCKSILGFKDVSFDFYDESYTRGSTRLVISAIVGIFIGAIAIFEPLYAILTPFAIFGMLLVLYAPVTGVYAAVFLGAIIPTMLLAAICLWTTFALIIKALSTKDFKWKFEGTGLGLLVLLALLLVSSILSFAAAKSITVWAMYFVFILFFFVFVNAIETKEQLYAIIKVFIISGALVALYGIMQYMFGWTTTNAWIDETMFEEQTMRVYSTLGNPNVLGEFLLLVLPLAAVQFLKNKANTLAKYGYLAMMSVSLLCLILTQSRGCWLGFILSAAVFVTFWKGRLWGVIPIIICLLPFVLPQTVIDRLLSIGDMSDSSTSYRVFIWLGTFEMLKYYWLGGIGMGEGAFAQVYPFYSYNAIVAPHSHNTFLQLTVEAGIGALIVFLVTQFIFLKRMVRAYRHDDKHSFNSLTALAIGAAVLGFLLQSMFDYTFYNYRVMALFFMVMAMGVTLSFFTEKEKECEVSVDE